MIEGKTNSDLLNDIKAGMLSSREFSRRMVKNDVLSISPVAFLALQQLKSIDKPIITGWLEGDLLGPSITYGLKKLAKAGYVETKVSEYDKRAKKVKITPSGLKLLEELGL